MLGTATRRRMPLPGRGVEIALLDWGGDGPLLLMHHANGFCAATLALVAESLCHRYRVVGMDARGQGDSSPGPGPDPYHWDAFAEDYLAVAEQLVAEAGTPARARRIEVGLGHSFGGTAALGAAARRPGLFGRLVLVEPVVPPPLAAARALDPARPRRLRRLVDGARRRRSAWPSREAAREHFASRSLFAAWDPRALDLYVAEGLRERADGRVELKCPGAVEAAVFGQSGSLDVAALAARAQLPVRVLWATRGDFPRPVYERVFGAMQGARIEDAECGHLVPMERPDLVVEQVLAGEADARDGR